MLHGDRRPYHIVAAEEARARGIAVFATDLGYVRPDWITLEYDGMTTYSRFPRDPDAIRTLAAELGPPDLEPRFQNPFWLIATLDIAYNLGLVFGRPLFPRYRYHSIVHPFAEYAGWLWSRGRRLFTTRRRERRKGTSAAGARLLFSGAAAAGDRLPDPRALAVSRRPRGGARDHRLVCPQRQSAQAGLYRASAR